MCALDRQSPPQQSSWNHGAEACLGGIFTWSGWEKPSRQPALGFRTLLLPIFFLKFLVIILCVCFVCMYVCAPYEALHEEDRTGWDPLELELDS